MAEAAAPQQQKINWKTNLLWGAPLGVILGILLACIYYFGFENTTPNLFNDQLTGFAGYELLLAFLFFLSSFLCGRVTGNGDDGLRIALIAFLAQAFTALFLIVVFSRVFNFWDWDHYGLGVTLFGYDDESGSFGYGFTIVLLICFETPWAILSAFIGGRIGSRFLHRQPRAEERADT